MKRLYKLFDFYVILRCNTYEQQRSIYLAIEQISNLAFLEEDSITLFVCKTGLRTSRYPKELGSILHPQIRNELLFIAKECIVIHEFILIYQMLCTQP